MKKRKWKKAGIGITVAAGIAAAGIFGVAGWNQLHSQYGELNETDQFILKEYNEYCKNMEGKEIWENFELERKTIAAVDTSSGKAYLINPTEKVKSIFAKKIELPSDYSIEVYRVSALAPQLFMLRFDNNFNTIGEAYHLLGNEIYYTKYNDTQAVSVPNTSEHYITFLNHEAFHYYMQNDWGEGSTYSVEGLSDEDKELLYKEYDVLTKIQTALLNDDQDIENYREYAKEYVAVAEERMQKNPEYVQKEMERETVEGTATYVGIKASEQVGYDYGVMYFDNIKNVPLSDLRTTVEAGSYDKRYLADRIPYETGALLCMLMDRMEIPEWQNTLNQQKEESRITLYSIISEFTKTY